MSEKQAELIDVIGEYGEEIPEPMMNDYLNQIKGAGMLSKYKKQQEEEKKVKE